MASGVVEIVGAIRIAVAIAVGHCDKAANLLIVLVCGTRVDKRGARCTDVEVDALAETVSAAFELLRRVSTNITDQRDKIVLFVVLFCS